ncbi:pyocin knob domain-containing protein [Paenibacillus sp. FSL K6-1230]|uniref:pyocin knob domain-containing protein n=1 Tax=Paenibacillus sp. FSL K6-1230 TaxID=2921603 RepID=UPI0030FCC8EC
MPYNGKTDWQYDDTVTETDLNRIEQGIEDAYTAIDNIHIEDGSLTQKGIVQLTNDTESTSQTLVPTAAALSDALQQAKDYADNEIGAIPGASTVAAGIVQLYNGVNSTSQTMAATANSVKFAYDLANSGFVPRGAAPNDFNSAATVNGSYTYANGGSLNAPGGITGAQLYGVLQVAVAGSYVTQRYTAVVTGEIWERSRTESTWAPWRQVMTSFGGRMTGSLSVDAGTLGTTAGSQSDTAYFGTNTGNATGLFVRQTRVTNGNNWTSSATDLQRRTDSTDQAVLRFEGDDVKFQNADGSWTSLRSLKQLSSDQKTKWASAITGKGGTASSSMTSDQLYAATMALVPREIYADQSYDVNFYDGSQEMRRTLVTLPAGLSKIIFTAPDTASCRSGVSPNSTSNQNANIASQLLLVDAAGNYVDVCTYALNGTLTPGFKYRSNLSFIYDAIARTVRVVEDTGGRTVNLPVAFNTAGALSIQSRFYWANSSMGQIGMSARIVGTFNCM